MFCDVPSKRIFWIEKEFKNKNIMGLIIKCLEEGLEKRNRHKRKWVGTKPDENWSIYDKASDQFADVISNLKAEKKTVCRNCREEVELVPLGLFCPVCNNEA